MAAHISAMSMSSENMSSLSSSYHSLVLDLDSKEESKLPWVNKIKRAFLHTFRKYSIPEIHRVDGILYCVLDEKADGYDDEGPEALDLTLRIIFTDGVVHSYTAYDDFCCDSEVFTFQDTQTWDEKMIDIASIGNEIDSFLLSMKHNWGHKATIQNGMYAHDLNTLQNNIDDYLNHGTRFIERDQILDAFKRTHYYQMKQKITGLIKFASSFKLYDTNVVALICSMTSFCPTKAERRKAPSIIKPISHWNPHWDDYDEENIYP